MIKTVALKSPVFRWHAKATGSGALDAGGEVSFVPLVPSATTPTTISPWKCSVAVLCALSIWLIGIFGSSSRLHAALHGDSDHADHTCSITLLNHGMDGSSAAICLVVAPVDFVQDLSVGAVTAPVLNELERQPPGRGPPQR